MRVCVRVLLKKRKKQKESMCVCMFKRFDVGGFVQTSLHMAAQALNNTCRNYGSGLSMDLQLIDVRPLWSTLEQSKTTPIMTLWSPEKFKL